MLAATVLHFNSFNLATFDLCPLVLDQQQTLVLVSRLLANCWTGSSGASASGLAALACDGIQKRGCGESGPVEEGERPDGTANSPSPPALAVSGLTAEGTAAASESLFLTT